MSHAKDRTEFSPPPQRGTLRALGLALIAHALLIAALTWGVHWKRDTESDAVEAEIWSSTAQQAAPRLNVQPPPAPAPQPAPAPAPTPRPPAPPPPQVRTPEPAPRAPDIALERDKKLREQKLQHDRELAEEREEKKQQARDQATKDAALKAAQAKKQQEADDRAADLADRKAADRKAADKLADAKKKQEADALSKQKADAAAKADATDRSARLKALQGMAGASGSDDATGTALKSSGPSGSYGGKVAAAVRPNIVFPDADTVSGNPMAEFEVRLAPDGTIVGTPKLVKSSGLPAWDDAALRALQKTDRLPRDIDGRVPSSLIVGLKPKR